jgi:NACHT N-terminal Helical domain 7/AAA domain
MMLSVTFEQVCKFLREDVKQEPKLLNVVDRLLGLALICGQLSLPSGIVAMLPALSVKNELTQSGRWLFERLTSKSEKETLPRLRRIQVAYGLLVYTAFFTALDQRLPESLRNRIKHHRTSYEIGTAGAACDVPLPKALDSIEQAAGREGGLEDIPLPGLGESWHQQIERHARIWRDLTNGFQEALQTLPVWQELHRSEQSDILLTLKDLPDATRQFFADQCFELAARFPDFAIWAGMQQHERTRQAVGDLKAYLQSFAELKGGLPGGIDVGFSRLRAAAQVLPDLLHVPPATELLEGLDKAYRKSLEKPLISPAEGFVSGVSPHLSFPSVCEAFIPQAFQVILQSEPTQKLGAPETWTEIPRRQDLNAFLLTHLTSPHSLELPLLILGEPGSGKSLLTIVLAAQLMSESFTVVHVPLRDVGAEAEITTQIEQAISRSTHTNHHGWAQLSSRLKTNPLVVILDGYDELLQASGLALSNYVRRVQQFQQTEFDQDRPVRVIITSRLTLIHKADVPRGTTVIRLLPFDAARRDLWISIWNRSNRRYFEVEGVEPFSMPELSQDEGSRSIHELATQPLLLAMLALYDSQNNQLRRSRGLDQSQLYDNLLRRFVNRQNLKQQRFGVAEQLEQGELVDLEMQRLGVAAFGMYNRRKIHILDEELSADLRFFGLEKPRIPPGPDRVMGQISQADHVLGGFFFVHKAKAQHGVGSADVQRAFSYEFLHLTFGEFLTADFILRRLVSEIEALSPKGASRAQRAKLQRLQDSPDGFDEAWFAVLIYTPLYSRTAVLKMMHEWIAHLLRKRGITPEELQAGLDSILLREVGRLINRKEMPSMLRLDALGGQQLPFESYPLLGHMAIYSINLFILRLVVCDVPYVFDEDAFGSAAGVVRPWDRLNHLWRSWFSLEALEDVSAVLRADREGSRITLRARPPFLAQKSASLLQQITGVSVTLADDVTAGLAGLLSLDPSRGTALDEEGVASRLKSAAVDLDIQVQLKSLARYEYGVTPESGELARQRAREIVRRAIATKDTAIIEAVAALVERSRARWNLAAGHDPAERPDIVDSGAIEGAVALSKGQPRLAIAFFRIFSELQGTKAAHLFRGEFIHATLERTFKGIADSIEMQSAYLSLLDQAWLPGGDSVRTDPVPHPEIMDRALDGNHVAQLCESSPGGALVLVRVAHWAALEKQFRNTHADAVAREVTPQSLQILLGRFPYVALAWLRFAREAAGEGFARRFPSESAQWLKQFVRSTQQEMSGRELMRAVTLLAVELGMVPATVEDARIALDLFNPAKLALGTESEQELLRLRATAERVAHHVRMLGSHEVSTLFSGKALAQLLEANPMAFATFVHFARFVEVEEIRRAVAECLTSSEFRAQLQHSVHNLRRLPLWALTDLRKVAQETNWKLAEAIRELSM